MKAGVKPFKECRSGILRRNVRGAGYCFTEPIEPPHGERQPRHIVVEVVCKSQVAGMDAAYHAPGVGEHVLGLCGVAFTDGTFTRIYNAVEQVCLPPVVPFGKSRS